MVLAVFVISAFLFAPPSGAECCVDVSRAAPVMEAGRADGFSASTASQCCASRPGDAPEAPCAPDDGCCAACPAHGKRLVGAPAVPGPAQEQAPAAMSRPAPRVGADHGGAVWHPPRG